MWRSDIVYAGGNNSNNMIVFGHYAVSVALLQWIGALHNQ